MPNKAPDCVIVLAAGKGSRMGSATIHKVCFEIDGVPAIVRALEVYRQCGIPQNLVVVGALAGQVVETVGAAFPNSAFAYQNNPNGTAGAVRAALAATPDMRKDAAILIVAGDRLIEREVVEQLSALYFESRCDLALLALPTAPGSGSGRLATDAEGEIAAIIEMADIRKKRTIQILRRLIQEQSRLSGDRIREVIATNFSDSEAKCRKAFGKLPDLREISTEELPGLLPESECFFSVAMPDGSTGRLSPDEAENLRRSNTSVYITSRGNLEYAVANLNADNAQQEEYLSDIAAVLRRKSPGVRIRSLLIEDRSKVLGFNNLTELLEVSESVRLRTARPPAEPDRRFFLPLCRYMELIENALSGNISPAFFAELEQIYGGDRELIIGHLNHYLPLLKLAAQRLPESAPVAVVRAPGRVNVMGRHVDHQGGNCNLMTINFETLMVVSPRSDDVVRLEHLNQSAFTPCEFSISGLARELPGDNWQSVVDSPQLARLIGEYGVDWSHYVKAAALRLQKQFNRRPLSGMNLFVAGNVPMAAGLSSSSSLIVGAAEAVVAVNRLDTFPAQLVSLCGEGEWFVGTRGGAADHAAVKLGEKNKVVKVGFFDFRVEESVPFPESHVMVLCDSGIKARKAGNAKDQFNHRVSCYRLGFRLLRLRHPEFAGKLRHLRDFNAACLGVPPADIYRMLLELPEQATRKELEDLLKEDLLQLWATHCEPEDGCYPVRQVVLFGLSECARSRIYPELLKRGDMAAIGRLMKASHDGDRVARLRPDGSLEPFFAPGGDEFLTSLIRRTEAGDPAAGIEFQTGGYRCSLPEIDLMVDVADRVPGVVGSQLAGAGLGGCMMVLAARGAVPELKEALANACYRPRGLPEKLLVCRPIAGSGILRVPPEL